MSGIFNWISVHWVEVAASLVSITYVILTIRQIIWLWFFGILSALLYAWVYSHSGFYAGMALQGYYAVISIYGWFHWTSRKRNTGKGSDLPIIRLTRRLLVILLSSWLVLWLLIGWFVSEFTDSTIPYWDAFTAAGGIVATWMLARKILEQWLFWIAIDLISIGLYIWQGLYATTVLFSIYVVMAIIGYRQWQKAWKMI